MTSKKDRVEDQRTRASWSLEEWLTARADIAAKLDAIESELVRSQRSHNSLLGTSRDQNTDQFHRIVSRLDALDAAVQAIADKLVKPPSPWWFRRR